MSSDYYIINSDHNRIICDHDIVNDGQDINTAYKSTLSATALLMIKR